jgi:hypothetical protein
MCTDAFQTPVMNRIRSDIMFIVLYFCCCWNKVDCTYVSSAEQFIHLAQVQNPGPQTKPKQDSYIPTLTGPNEFPTAHELFYTLPVQLMWLQI